MRVDRQSWEMLRGRAFAPAGSPPRDRALRALRGDPGEPAGANSSSQLSQQQQSPMGSNPSSKTPINCYLCPRTNLLPMSPIGRTKA